MAAGFSPKHEESFEILDLTNQEFIVIALETIKKLEWNAGSISEKGVLAYTKLSMSSYGEEVKIIFDQPTLRIRSQCSGSQFFDMGKNKGNVNDFYVTFKEIRETYDKTQLAEKYNELSSTIQFEDHPLLDETPLSGKEKLSNFFAIFKPTEGYFVTPILANLNILIFLVMVLTGVNVFLPEGEELIKWGANFKPTTLNGEWWRLLTCCFLHIGIFHLAMNMYALIYIGVLLEPILGTKRFLAAYLITGIAASLTSLVWHDLTISAGASGAIFGMYGVFLALLTTNHIEKSARNSLLVSIGIFVGYNLLNGMKSGIDNAAHIGGLLSGLLIGFAFFPTLKQKESKTSENIAIGAMSLVILLATFFVCTNLKNDLKIYEDKMKDFVALETKALEIYSIPETTPSGQALAIIQNKGIDSWEKCLVLLNDLQKLDLPEMFSERNEKLKYYCHLRIESYQLISKNIRENTDKYNEELNSCNTKIEQLISELSAE